jgi:hypothetical protein
MDELCNKDQWVAGLWQMQTGIAFMLASLSAVFVTQYLFIQDED